MTLLLTRVSYLNFLAGLLAAIGTGYFSAIPFSSAERDAMIVPLLVAAALWIACSALLAGAAHRYAIALDTAASRNVAAYSTSEQSELIQMILRERRVVARALWVGFWIVLLLSIGASATVLYWPEISTWLSASMEPAAQGVAGVR